MSAYTISGDMEDLHLSTTMYEMYDAYTQNLGLGLKANNFDCNDLDIKNIQKEVAKQTIGVAKNVHGGAKAFSGSRNLGHAAQKSDRQMAKRCNPAI